MGDFLLLSAFTRAACLLAFYACLHPAQLPAQNTPVYFSPDPGPAHAEASDRGFALSNGVVKAGWQMADGKIVVGELDQRLAALANPLPANLFTLLADGRVLTASDMKVIRGPAVTDLTADPSCSRWSGRLAGKAIVLEFGDPSLRVTWRALLRDGSNYIRQEVTIDALHEDVALTEVRLIDWSFSGAQLIGTVKGSPVASDHLFAAIEHPLSSCSVAMERVLCRIHRELPLKAGHSVTYSSVIGVVSPGQLRRSFLYYLERERAHPYRTFLHYNSWYDLGYFNKYDQASALDVINRFGVELAEKRRVRISSFLFDDGWDDSQTLWHFNQGFPNGFAPLREAAAKYGAAPGVWLSPWGGYGEPKQQRVVAAKRAQYEIIDNGFALSGPKYYRLFRDTCAKFIRDYGVNQFKFDGTGNADRVFPGSTFDSDFAAAIGLIGELRAVKPDLFINLTTGTYPSPFWLRYADSIWRDGEDHSFLGVGSNRERWITYRDAMTYEHIVLGGPLYPLNSLMLHGIIYAKRANGLNSDPGGDFKHEVRDYFGTGTQTQELYLTPSLLSSADWDTLAEAANWSRKNAGVLVDTHWIGGDPAQLEVYGWASWNPGKAVLVLRNPSDKAQQIAIDTQQAFELPPEWAPTYRMHSPFKEQAKQGYITLPARRPHTFSLKPFEVLVLEGTPTSRHE